MLTRYICLFACLIHLIPAQTPKTASLEAALRQHIDSGELPSISIAVAQKGKIIWEYVYGFADAQKQIAVTRNTPYYTASVSKAITAAAIMQLVERKAIDLDHPANNYLGDAKLTSPKWDPSTATVRRLANHTAGLTTYDRSCYIGEPQCSTSADELIHRYGIVMQPPGQFDYSNADYGILGEIVAHVSGQSLATYLKKNIFQQAGMASCFLATKTSPMKTAAIRYTAGAQNTHFAAPTPPSFSTAPGGSSVYCSAHDAALFGSLQLKNRVTGHRALLTDKSIDDMWRSSVPAQPGQAYSLGWWLQDNLHGFRGLQAQGGTSDSSAYLQLIPSEDIAVAMFTNTGTGAGPNIVDDVLAVFLPQYAANLRTEQSTSTQSAQPNPPPPPPTAGKWSGFVQTYLGKTTLEVSAGTAGIVKAKLGAQPEAIATRVRYRGAALRSFQIPGTLSLDDPWLEPYSLTFYLNEDSGSFYGEVTTTPELQARHGARLSFWLELKPQPMGQ